MGIFNSIFSKKNKVDNQFVELVRASDDGEEWAKSELQSLWQRDGNDLVVRIHQARVYIYEDAAQNGNRDAIIKYARGLAYSGRENEAVSWYMSLIKHNDAGAMLELSSDYSEFGPLETNAQEELKWLAASAQAGNAQGQYKYALMLAANGDDQNALLWYEKSASNGYPEGKLGYAKSLEIVKTAIVCYLCSPENLGSDEYFYINKYSVTNYESGMKVLGEINQLAEALLVDVLNESEEDTSIWSAHNSLAFLYLYPPMNLHAPKPYRAAYLYYMNYYYFNEEADFERLKDVTSKYELNITNNTLKEWENIGFEEWAEMYGVDE